MADNLLFEQSNESQITTEPFVSRQVVYVVDQNNGAYNGQIQLDTSSLSNSGKYASYSEAYFEIPLVVTLQPLDSSPTAGYTAGGTFANTTNAFAAGLKAGYWHLIHSLSVEYNNTSVVQLTPFTNMYVHYKMITSMSQEDVAKVGAGLGFFPDTATSFKFSADRTNLVNGSATGFVTHTTGNASLTNMNGQGLINNSDFGVLNIAPTNGTITAGTVVARLAQNNTATNLRVVNDAQIAAANDPIISGGGANPTPVNTPITSTTGGVAFGVRAVGGNVDFTAPAGGVTVNISSSALTAGWQGQASNLGFYQRQQSTSYDPTVGNFGAILPSGSCVTVGKNYYDSSNIGSGTNPYVAWYILAKIRLKDECDFFDKLPLVKGAYLRFIINTNTAIHNLTYCGFNQDGTARRAFGASSNIITGGTTPLLWASGESGQGSSSLSADARTYIVANPTQAVNFRLQLGIAQVTVNNATVKHPTLQQCRLYVPLYQMNPTMEEQYLSLNRTKKVVYRDIYQYQTSIAGGADFNVLLTNGISNPKFVVCTPMISGATSTTISNGGGGAPPYTLASGGNIVGFIQNSTNANPPTQAVALPVYQSPFASEPATTSPLIALTNFNIQIAGQNMFIQNELYDFEQFTNELQSVNAINGGLVTGLTSGLISETDFQYMYRYYICDVSRRLPAEDRVPKSVQILGKNTSTQPITLFTFIEFEKEIEIDLITGQKLS
jgi:hypothetical protein